MNWINYIDRKPDSMDVQFINGYTKQPIAKEVFINADIRSYSCRPEVWRENENDPGYFFDDNGVQLYFARSLNLQWLDDNPWIECKEGQMPVNSQSVLFTQINTTNPHTGQVLEPTIYWGYYCDGYTAPVLGPKGFRSYNEPDPRDLYTEVTHWMPIPKPPKNTI